MPSIPQIKIGNTTYNLKDYRVDDFGVKTSLPRPTDLNTVISRGTYNLFNQTSTDGYTNAPSTWDVSTDAILFVDTGNVPNTAWQVFIDITGNVSTRKYINGSWTSWSSVTEPLIEVDPFVVNGAAFDSTNMFDVFGNYMYICYEVGNENELWVTGTDFGAGFSLITYLDSNCQKIGVVRGSGYTVKKKITLPQGCKYVIVNGTNEGSQDNHPFGAKIYSKNPVKNGKIQSSHRDRLYTLQDAFKEWMFGHKFPITVLGDSTTDGNTTTDNTANVIGSDHRDPNTYTTILEEYLQTATNNNLLRIYNAGFSGKGAAWALQNIEDVIWNNDYYKDTKIIIISHGINDYVTGYGNYYLYQHNLSMLVMKCFEHGVQPVLMTHQAGMENIDRISRLQMALADGVTRQVAQKYNLELIDKNEFTSFFNTYSSLDITQIIPDGCHYSDAGHKFVAGAIFNQLVPFTILAGEGETVIGFNEQKIKTQLRYSSVTEHKWLDVKIITPTNGFKLEANCSKDDATTLLDVWVYVYSKKNKKVMSYCNNPNVQNVDIDGTITRVTSTEQNIARLDLGLHHIIVTSDASANVNYLGLKIVDAD